MDKDNKLLKVDITEIELMDIPDCRFKSDMLEILGNGGKVKLKIKAPMDFIDAKNKSKAAKAGCVWWQIWCK